jgi:hypothetical protein
MTDNLERLRARNEHLAQWAVGEIESGREVIAAAKNLIAVKGRHHTEQAFSQLAAAIAKHTKVKA